MHKKIESYYEVLRGLTHNIIITDKTGKVITTQKGFEKIADLFMACALRNKKLIFIGNGASAAISSHMAVDFSKHAGIRGIAFNDSSLLTCISNDFGYDHVFEKPLELFADKGDILVAISSSGKSPNILAAVRAARRKGVLVVSFSGFLPENPLRASGDLNFYVPAKAYSHVEIMHHSLLHYVLDSIADTKKE
ncbi:MAG: SIS domain-containing protein [Candidatus Omnitrophota bacterium]|jgi:D-sedoheptulose 7-phosphate isomerase